MELNSSWPWLPPSWCLALHGFVLSLFLLPCIMKMRSSCEPWGSQMGLWMSLPLLTTNSLSGGGQFPLCCYNLFGFQVPHGIKKQFAQPWRLGGVRIQAGLFCFSVLLRDTLSGEKPFSRAGTALCVTDRDCRMCLGLEGIPSNFSYLPRNSQQIWIEHPRCARRQGCNSNKIDRIPDLLWIRERHTSQQIKNGDNFKS